MGDATSRATAAKTSLLQDFILEGLSYASMKDRQEEVAEAHSKTFEWIFVEPDKKDLDQNHSNFVHWLTQDGANGIYWINGKAGSGKSTLMQFIYNHETTTEQLRSWAGETPLTIAGFFFWTSGSLEQRSQAGLLRSLLYQLCQQHRNLIPVTFPDLWERCWAAKTTQERIKISMDWTLPGLISSFKLCLDQMSNDKIFLIVDGLDEFDGDHAQIIDLFTSIVGSANGKIKACLSSRPWPVFEAAFESVPKLKLQDLTFNDMSVYVEDKLKEPRIRRILRKAPEEASEFMVEIVQRANGVFLWVTLGVQSLINDIRTNDTVSDLQSLLRQLPTDLDNLFRHLLFDLQPLSSQKEASRIFQLLRARETVCEFTRDESAASMTVWELALADEGDQILAIEASVHQASSDEITARCQSMKDRVQSQCAGLLELHGKRGRSQASARFLDENHPANIQMQAQTKVTYLHRTVRDFLMYSGVWDILLQLATFDAHVCHLRSYVLQLKFALDEPERHRRLDEWWPDIVLAMTHARYSERDPCVVQLLDELNKTLTWYWLARGPEPIDNWARSSFGSYEERGKTEFHQPFLSLATKFGIQQYVEQKLPVPYIAGIPLLTYATEFLVDRRKTVYPLSSPDLVKTILEIGADPNQSYKSLSQKDETPWLSTLKYLRQANRRGWIRNDETSRWVDIMKLFLEYGADPNAMIPETRMDVSATALEIVTLIVNKYGLEKVRELRDMLLQRGARVREGHVIME